jgi:aspartate aminotransferase
MNKLSDRITGLTESATIAMAQKAREYKAKGINIISLSLGEPDFKTPKHIQQAAKEAIDSEEYFTYSPVPGYADLRKAIAEKLQRENNIKSTENNIVVSTGAKQSIINTLLCLVNPGDEVIVYSPFWVSYVPMVELCEGKPVLIKGSLENNFKATARQLEEAITDKTKVVIYSSPSNPTGSVFSREELQAMADVLKKHKNIMVIADEIYEHINYVGGHVSLGSFPEVEDQVVTVNGFAKGYAMTGWRVGYISAPEWLAKACNKMQGQFTSGTNGIAQRAALAAITGDQEPTRKMTEQYRRRRDLVLELLQEIPGMKTYTPSGAFYFFPDVSAYFGRSYNGETIHNADDLAIFLIDHAHVSVVTGDAFGAPECIRLSYAASEEELREALKRMKEALAKLS